MSMRTSRPVAAALAVAVTLTSFQIAPASAADNSARTEAIKTSTVDMSARRHWRGGNAVALGAILGVFGTIATVAAANQYRDRYAYYYGAPAYGPYYEYSDTPYDYGVPYGGGPVYFSAPGGGFRHFHHHHHW